MLTGAFAYKRIDNTSEFYKRSFAKLGIPTLVFSALYSVWYIFLEARTGDMRAGIFRVARLWKTGWSGHPLWYMYMLVGLYALIPIVKKAIKETKMNVLVVSVLLCVWASISWYTSKFNITWNLGRVALYISYVIMGYAIRATSMGKDNKIGILFIVCGFVLLIMNGFLVYRCFLLGSNWRNWGNNFSPFVMFGSILIFLGFCKINYTNRVKVAKYTFVIYLFHKGVLEIAQFMAGKVLPVERPISLVFIAVLVEVIIVFIISLGLSISYSKLTRFFSNSKPNIVN